MGRVCRIHTKRPVNSNFDRFIWLQVSLVRNAHFLVLIGVDRRLIRFTSFWMKSHV